MRLDCYVYEKFNLKSRTYARQLIDTGCVTLNGRSDLKAGTEVEKNDDIQIVSPNDYASQGAYKLEEAFEKFGLSVKNKITADLGCSNGGFTDVLLRRGIKKVFAVDVGECALPKNILESGRVEFIKANVRYLPPIEKCDFVCSDLSFISLKLVLENIFDLLKDDGEAVALVKPQFEAGKKALNKNGIVKNAADREKVLSDIEVFARSVGFSVAGETVSPIRFQNKNIEYLLYLKKTAKPI